jgi:hypothetical protein
MDLNAVAVQLRAVLGIDRRSVLAGIDESEVPHAAEHIAPALPGALRVGDGVELGRGLGQPGDHRELRKAQMV